MLKGACILDFDRFWIFSLPYQVDMVYANSILPGIWYMQIQYFQGICKYNTSSPGTGDAFS
jgi:hypothetical protein